MTFSADFLVGTTASGKSAVAQFIAERAGRTVVSADSMNIYRGMDIGTAKPNAEERKRVPYAGIDLSDPTESFNVASYLAAVAPVLKSDQKPIVAGGTGLYVKCLTEGLDDVVPENAALRAELEALEFHALEKRAREEASDLYQSLTEDDQQNPRRLIRILERKTPTERRWNTKPRPQLAGLYVEREALLERIERRIDKMYAEGLLDEARTLAPQQLSQTALQAIGYAEAFSVLRGECSVEEAKEKTMIRTRQLAKRQMTWFRNQLNVEWINTAEYPNTEQLAEAVLNVWNKNGPTPLMLD